ncbi:collagen alpha-1(I) chain-like [Varanus komodoensis]|uniref:collagen alpha-1(I) chain-like n=1 Tax=Varanus komodoensis TaxID=61221 RepID=UPI001CF7A226|nr:collagen alpha-1(I) chain-like [Varanus komodoensis]
MAPHTKGAAGDARGAQLSSHLCPTRHSPGRAAPARPPSKFSWAPVPSRQQHPWEHQKADEASPKHPQEGDPLPRHVTPGAHFTIFTTCTKRGFRTAAPRKESLGLEASARARPLQSNGPARAPAPPTLALHRSAPESKHAACPRLTICATKHVEHCQPCGEKTLEENPRNHEVWRGKRGEEPCQAGGGAAQRDALWGTQRGCLAGLGTGGSGGAPPQTQRPFARGGTDQHPPPLTPTSPGRKSKPPHQVHCRSHLRVATAAGSVASRLPRLSRTPSRGRAGQSAKGPPRRRDTAFPAPAAGTLAHTLPGCSPLPALGAVARPLPPARIPRLGGGSSPSEASGHPDQGQNDHRRPAARVRGATLCTAPVLRATASTSLPRAVTGAQARPGSKPQSRSAGQWRHLQGWSPVRAAPPPESAQAALRQAALGTRSLRAAHSASRDRGGHAVRDRERRGARASRAQDPAALLAVPWQGGQRPAPLRGGFGPPLGTGCVACDPGAVPARRAESWGGGLAGAAGVRAACRMSWTDAQGGPRPGQPFDPPPQREAGDDSAAGQHSWPGQAPAGSTPGSPGGVRQWPSQPQKLHVGLGGRGPPPGPARAGSPPGHSPRRVFASRRRAGGSWHQPGRALDGPRGSPRPAARAQQRSWQAASAVLPPPHVRAPGPGPRCSRVLLRLQAHYEAEGTPAKGERPACSLSPDSRGASSGSPGPLEPSGSPQDSHLPLESQSPRGTGPEGRWVEPPLRWGPSLRPPAKVPGQLPQRSHVGAEASRPSRKLPGGLSPGPHRGRGRVRSAGLRTCSVCAALAFLSDVSSACACSEGRVAALREKGERWSSERPPQGEQRRGRAAGQSGGAATAKSIAGAGSAAARLRQKRSWGNEEEGAEDADDTVRQWNPKPLPVPPGTRGNRPKVPAEERGASLTVSTRRQRNPRPGEAVGPPTLALFQERLGTPRGRCDWAPCAGLDPEALACPSLDWQLRFHFYLASPLRLSELSFVHKTGTGQCPSGSANQLATTWNHSAHRTSHLQVEF